MWLTRSTFTRSKIILGIATRCGELQKKNRSNTAGKRIPGVIDLNGGTAGCTATKKVSKLIEIFENISGKNNSSKTRVKSKDHQVQRGIKAITRRHEPHRDLRTFHKTGSIISVAGEIWSAGGGPTILQKTNYNFNPWLCHWELQSRTKTWCPWKTGDVLPGEADA